MFEHLLTPALLVDHGRLTRNVERMQSVCDASGVALWPHIKTHKMVEVARMQLAAGAQGLTCAKIGEAEALLPSGVRRVFLAHSLVDPLQAPRLRALADSLDELIVACTSEAQAEALERVLAAAELRLPVLMAVDTGLGREGARGPASAAGLAAAIGRQPHLCLRGVYTHEGHTYGGGENADEELRAVHERLVAARDRIDPSLSLWPGCSVTAARMAALGGVAAVRPGAYVFGDLNLTITNRVMDWEDVALTVLATVVDRPAPGLALVDAGSKTFSSDRTPDGTTGLLPGSPGARVTRCSEEHGWVTGPEADALAIGERVRFVPAHVCPVVNLADEVVVLRDGQAAETWRVAARGKVQ